MRERLSRLSRNQRRGLLSAALVVVVGAAVASFAVLGADPPPPKAAVEPVVDPPPPAELEPAKRVSKPKRRLRMRIDERAASPVAVSVPDVDISAPIVPLGLQPNGELEVPKDFGDAGWRFEGPEPGERGASLITAHVDSKSGPAAFYRLGDVSEGDEIKVRRRDGSTVSFIAERFERVPKDDFPTERVYGKTRLPTLRLVTCGGGFDAASGHYRDNLIVYATRAPS